MPFLVLLKEMGDILDNIYFVFWTKLYLCFQDCLVLSTRSTIYEYQNKPGSCSVTALEGLLSMLSPQQLLDGSVAVLFQLLIENQGLNNRGGDGGG